jgi:large subunit ribosomal protein L9
MKIVLTQDVPKLGNAGTLQDVAPGFARNFLIPRGMATVATRGSIKQVEERQAAESRRIAKQEQEMRGLAERLQGMRIEVQARVGEQGRLYGSVTAGDIAEQLISLVGEEIDRRKVDLDEPIRTAGDHTVTVRLVGKLAPTITVHVFDPEHPTVNAAADAGSVEGETETDANETEAE